MTDAAPQWRREATRRQVEAIYSRASHVALWELRGFYRESARLADTDVRSATWQHQLDRARERIIVVEELIIALDASERETRDKYSVHTLDRYDDPYFEVPEQIAQKAIADLQKQRDAGMKAAEDRYTLRLEGTARRTEESGRFIVQATQAIEAARVQGQTGGRLAIEQPPAHQSSPPLSPELEPHEIPLPAPTQDENLDENEDMVG